MAANRKKLMLPEEMAKVGWDVARRRDDVELVGFSDKTPQDEFRGLLQAADGIALWARRFWGDDIALAPRLQVVSRIGVGYDSVDVASLSQRRIPLLIGGTANSVTVAEHAIFFMLHLAKQGVAMDRFVRGDRWREKNSVEIFDLFEKTLLIIGFGKIGTRVAARALALEMRVLVYDPFLPEDAIRARGAIPAPDLDAALAEADFVTIHCPKKPDTIGLINAARLARMKQSAFLINTARGGIIDEPALFDALTSGKIAGAGLDVFETEPTPPDNPLLRAPNTIFAPHMAGVSRESLDRMAVTAVQNVFSVFDGKPNVENVVNKEVLA
jgi:D-3-phosphoglycerate dehydrogenase